jgi:hypothetical protein
MMSSTSSKNTEEFDNNYMQEIETILSQART